MKDEKDESYILVDSLQRLTHCVHDLSSYNSIVFHADGELCRSGALIMMCIQGVDTSETGKCTPVYVVDMQSLEEQDIFSTESKGMGLRKLLEDTSTLKIAFDCRRTSDVLFHCCNGIQLAGTLDLQVFDQAVRIHRGELPPKRERNWIPQVQSLERVAKRYNVPVPRVIESVLPTKQPLLQPTAISGADTIKTIRKMWHVMNKGQQVQPSLMRKTMEFSARYENIFRDALEEVTLETNKTLILEEIPIMSESELPPEHPRRVSETSSHRRLCRFPH